MTFTVHLREEADNALQSLSKSDYDLCFAKLNALAENPYPGVGGDKEKLEGRKNLYRIHLSRTFTAIYQIDKKKKRVCIKFFGRIGKAHKEY